MPERKKNGRPKTVYDNLLEDGDSAPRSRAPSPSIDVLPRPEKKFRFGGEEVAPEEDDQESRGAFSKSLPLAPTVYSSSEASDDAIEDYPGSKSNGLDLDSKYVEISSDAAPGDKEADAAKKADGGLEVVVKNGAGGAELVASWDAPGPSETPLKRNRKNARSRSWCATRAGDDGLTGSDIRLLRERLLRTQPLPQPAAIRSFTRAQRLTLVSLALVDFMSFCSMSIMAPFFPREAADKGMTETVSGFVFSFYALVMFVTSPVFGKILPVVGAKFLFMSGMFVAGSCNLLFGVLEYMHDYELFMVFCFLIRGLEALGASAYSTASYVYVVNTFPNNIGSVLGILETFVGLGMSVGPAIGGLLYSIGGFGLPFYVLGVAMVLAMPINYCLLPSQEDYSVSNKSGSLLELVKVPAVVITGLVIVVVSNTWAFLDPTLEPHLRQFGLSPEQVGLIFLLFSALYGLSSPLFGWLADRINRHWCMMFWGLLLCTTGLLLLGPSPLLPFLESSLWLNLLALSIIGVSVALTLLPTFQGVLSSSIEEGGCSDSLGTYSVVAGVWSCMYSLGEVIGPSLGGVLLRHYGFPVCSTVMAALTFTLAIITLSFFMLKESTKLSSTSDTLSSSATPGTWPSSDTRLTGDSEQEPLLSSDAGNSGNWNATYGTDSIVKLGSDLNRNRLKECGDTFKLRNIFRIDKPNPKPGAKIIPASSNGESIQTDAYEKYLEGSGRNSPFGVRKSSSYSLKEKDDCGNAGELKYKRDDSGLLPRLCDSLLNKHLRGGSHSRQYSDDLLRYNMEKIKYYGQNRREDWEDQVVDRDQVTDVRGTVAITPSGACEV